MDRKESRPLFGLAAEFEAEEQILAAAHRVHEAGYRCAEAYTPYAVHGLAEALGFRRSYVPLLVLVGATIGAVGGFFMLWFANVISYPWNIGGRPPNSWPAFIPITFELGVLGAGLMAALGMLALNGLPEPYHPMFHLPAFEQASRNRFFLCIERKDPSFDPEKTRAFLEALGAISVMEVPE